MYKWKLVSKRDPKRAYARCQTTNKAWAEEIEKIIRGATGYVKPEEVPRKEKQALLFTDDEMPRRKKD